MGKRYTGGKFARSAPKATNKKYSYSGGQCLGKLKHETRENAKLAKKKMMASGMPGAVDLQAFKCLICNQFHLGNPPKGFDRESLRRYRLGKVEGEL